jgi:hypothetical protein
MVQKISSRFLQPIMSTIDLGKSGAINASNITHDITSKTSSPSILQLAYVFTGSTTSATSFVNYHQ